MRSEKEKMLAGELYDANDGELASERRRARELCMELNSLGPDAVERRRELLDALFGARTDATIVSPFFCDYGYNITLGRNVYFNVNCVILDVVRVSIGNHALFGPGVHVYTASHPLLVEERRSGLELGHPVSIGDDVWIGGASIICPGVNIGPGCVIGAGSVVTRDVPASVLAAGNPCRLIRKL